MSRKRTQQHLLTGENSCKTTSSTGYNMSGIRSTCSDLLWQPYIIAEVLYGGTTAKKNTSFYHLHSKDATFPTAMGSTLLFFPFINHVV